MQRILAYLLRPLAQPEFDASRSRLHDAAVFLLKADGLALAGLVTLASALKLDPTQAVKSAGQIREVIDRIVDLLTSSLMFWSLVVLFESSDEHVRRFLRGMYRVAFLVVVSLHIAVISFAVGFFNAYVEGICRLP